MFLCTFGTIILNSRIFSPLNQLVALTVTNGKAGQSFAILKLFL